MILYIGETGRSLRSRFGAYEVQAKHSWVPCGISALFKSNFIHDSEYMKIHIFELRKKQ